MAGKSTTKSSETQKATKTTSKKETKEEQVVPTEQVVEQKPKKETKTKEVKGKVVKDKKETVKVVAKETDADQTEQADTDSKFQPQLLALQTELLTVRQQLQTITSGFKKLEACYKHDIKRVRKYKQKRTGPHKPTGFAKQQVVPEKLAKFIGVKTGEELTGPEITSRVWQQLKERNLTYEKDKRVFRTDKVVSDLFGVKSDVNKSTDHRDKNGFNFCNLQKYIAHALGKEVKTA
jgi:chromatin remodeling complex protein RSC6